ncbi:beta/gamma crystallin domain-containing protein [Streptomyces sp. NRRL F-5123]|uniref:beta/gamma crystallin domain-containing protein n=1 Tax=Streptomyces sp. NRRL F-5123 TaxID=1463856 RepID=UPI00131B9D07|nr:beta/gamma crystallin domain-containing protein [Streptomyces sp. NRRL F-5123]
MKLNRPFRVQGLAKKIAVTAVAAAGLALTLPATPAAAANWVDCRGIDEYVRVEVDYLPPACFANAGAIDVNLYGAELLHTGNNKVTFFYTIEQTGWQNALTMEKWTNQGMSFGLTAHVTSIVVW